eukprot:COSAG02_NODE_400_length_23094_cov_309.555990_11_plen_124_part_00
MNVTAKQGRTVWNGPQLHGPGARNGHDGYGRFQSHGEDDMHAYAHTHVHTGDASRAGLGAGWTTVVPDLPFCTVNRGPLLFALYARLSRNARLLCRMDIAQPVVVGTADRWRLALCTDPRHAK